MSNALRVALISTPFVAVPPPAYGGTELVLHYLARGLREAGAAVTLYATADSRAEGALVRARFPHALWPPDEGHEIEHLAFAVADARERGFDAVHVNSPAALALAVAARLPTICTVHHAREIESSAVYATRAPRAVLVAISERQRALEPGLATARVIHHGLDPADYRFGPRAGRDIAFLGRLSAAKGVHFAIDAAARVRRPIRLAGKVHLDGGGREYFVSEVAPRLERPGVEWVGEVGGARKQEHLSRAAVLVAPVDWEEPFGLVLIEAMLCGTPVAAFTRGAIPEVVEEGRTGALAAPGDGDALADAIERAARLDRAAVRERAAERWNHRRMTRAYLEAYARAGAP